MPDIQLTSHFRLSEFTRSTHHWIHIAYRQNGPNKMQVIDDLVKNK